MKTNNKVKEFYEKYPFPSDKIKSIEDLERHQWVMSVLKGIETKEKTCADIGCGTGEIACYLSTKFKSVKGFDFTNASLKNAKALKRFLSLTNIDFEMSDITLPANRGKYDFVFSTGVLHHIPDVKTALKNIKEMMHNDSYFVVSIYNKYAGMLWKRTPEKADNSNKNRIMDEFYHPYEVFYSKNEFKRLLEENGFEVIKIWRNLPDIVRLLTAKNGMPFYLCKKHL